MIVAIIGSRTFNDYNFMRNKLKFIAIDKIVSGGASGADTLAEKYAREIEVPILIIYPEYKKYGSAAPIKRNDAIISYCDMLVAFWDGQSKGTKYTIDIASKLPNIDVTVFNYISNDIYSETNILKR